MPIFPTSFIIAFIGFIFAYWVEKYIFTHQCCRPEMLDEIIEQFYANFFIVILFIGGIGDFVFLHNAYDTNVWTLLNIILFGVLIIVPYTRFITCNYIDINKSKYGNRPLSDVFFTFYNDYQRQNPLTKKEGLKNYLVELRKKGYLSDNAFNLAFNNIDNLNLMEIYYGISEENIPLVHQSVIGGTPADSTLSGCNFRRSLFGRGALKSTIIRPEIEDNAEQKKMKRNFYDSQIMNLLGKNLTNKGSNNYLSNIEEKQRESGMEQLNNETSGQDQLNLMNIPVSVSQYKNDDNNDDGNNNQQNNNNNNNVGGN